MHLDCTRPPKLFRYSEARWLERSLHFGEFRLRPATDYQALEGDLARQDNELVRVRQSSADKVKITLADTGQKIEPIGPVTYTSSLSTNYLTLCLSTRWDEYLFGDFAGSNCCLVIHDPEEFCERLHKAAKIALPDWAGIDGPVAYGQDSPLGPAFSKPLQFIVQHEWRFSWLPPEPREAMQPIILTIGNIEHFAEIRNASLPASSGA